MKIKVGEVYETFFGAIVKVVYIDKHDYVVVVEKEGPVCETVLSCPQYKANEKKCKICNKGKNRYCTPIPLLERKLSKIERALFTKF